MALGERGSAFCHQDTQAHVELLAVAVDFGSEAAFRHYVQWLSHLLQGRGLPGHDLARALHYLAGFLGETLPHDKRQAVLDLIEAGIRALDSDEDVPNYAQEPAGLDPAAETLAATLLAGDGDGARAQLLDCARGTWLPNVVARVVRPAMWRIGWWWQTGRISVAQEHLATEIAHRAVDNAFTHAARKPRRQRSALFACVEGNRHALGMRTLADAFEIDGWAAFNLGADVPAASLPGMVNAFRPELVGLSVSMTQQLPAARAAIEAIRALPDGGRIRIMLGGLASDSLEEAWRWTGADLAARDAPEALAAT
ncbi:MAG: cobalamin B12-binding domain-containing protein [Rhodocyclaceae bacterium]|nr:MAG: cobalamin B12-binding domain-containing protein [Rhodocyclaceae bacterium]TND00605.1 MAG: cobalamin B12-binding domain-containing protein [Rhodocyclaceae bacterium]